MQAFPGAQFVTYVCQENYRSVSNHMAEQDHCGDHVLVQLQSFGPLHVDFEHEARYTCSFFNIEGETQYHEIRNNNCGRQKKHMAREVQARPPEEWVCQDFTNHERSDADAKENGRNFW